MLLSLKNKGNTNVLNYQNSSTLFFCNFRERGLWPGALQLTATVLMQTVSMCVCLSLCAYAYQLSAQQQKPPPSGGCDAHRTSSLGSRNFST